MVATGFEAEGFEATGPRAACFSARGFGEAAGFARVARLGEVTCGGDLPCFDELSKMFDSQLASLTPAGRSIDAAIAAMMVRRQRQTAKLAAKLALKLALANFLPDDRNPCFPPAVFFHSCFMAAQDDTTEL